jgi:hypothetical protein
VKRSFGRTRTRGESAPFRRTAESPQPPATRFPSWRVRPRPGAVVPLSDLENHQEPELQAKPRGVAPLTKSPFLVTVLGFTLVVVAVMVLGTLQFSDPTNDRNVRYRLPTAIVALSDGYYFGRRDAARGRDEHKVLARPGALVSYSFDVLYVSRGENTEGVDRGLDLVARTWEQPSASRRQIERLFALGYVAGIRMGSKLSRP